MFSPVSLTLMPPHSTLNTFLSHLQPRAVVHFEISQKMSPSRALSEPLTSIPANASDFIKQTARAQQLSVSQLEKNVPSWCWKLPQDAETWSAHSFLSLQAEHSLSQATGHIDCWEKMRRVCFPSCCTGFKGN